MEQLFQNCLEQITAVMCAYGISVDFQNGSTTLSDDESWEGGLLLINDSPEIDTNIFAFCIFCAEQKTGGSQKVAALVAFEKDEQSQEIIQVYAFDTSQQQVGANAMGANPVEACLPTGGGPDIGPVIEEYTVTHVSGNDYSHGFGFWYKSFRIKTSQGSITGNLGGI